MDNKDMDIKGAALVTGGCRNLGLEISRRLMGCGYHVFATTRNIDTLPFNGPPHNRFEVLEADVSKVSGVRKVFEHIRCSGLVLKVLVNNASSYPRGPLLSLEAKEMRRAYESTLLSSFMCMKEAVPLMKGTGWGRIINIGMAGTDIIRGYKDVAAHASAKSALSVLTLSMAGELAGTGITVNMVNPGPVGRKGLSQEEIAMLSRLSTTGRLVPVKDVVNAVVSIISSDKNGDIITVL